MCQESGEIMIGAGEGRCDWYMTGLTLMDVIKPFFITRSQVLLDISPPPSPQPPPFQTLFLYQYLSHPDFFPDTHPLQALFASREKVLIDCSDHVRARSATVHPRLL